jgi:hypothetical protein
MSEGETMARTPRHKERQTKVLCDLWNGRTLSYMEVVVITRRARFKQGCLAGQKRARHSKVEQIIFFH